VLTWAEGQELSTAREEVGSDECFLQPEEEVAAEVPKAPRVWVLKGRA